MTESTSTHRLRQPGEIDDPLTDILRSGARRLLAQAIKMEAVAFFASMKGMKLADARDRLVRHGHGPERSIQTGKGTVTVSGVKIRDRETATDERIRFTSAILPLRARRTKSTARKYRKAAECLTKDRRALLTFYDAPAEHWVHLRTTSPMKVSLPPSGAGRCARKARSHRIPPA